MKRMLITLLFIFLSMTSCLNFATANDDEMIGEDDEKGLGKSSADLKKIEESDLSKHGLSKGRIVGIVMLAILLLIVAIKYIRGY